MLRERKKTRIKHSRREKYRTRLESKQLCHNPRLTPHADRLLLLSSKSLPSPIKTVRPWYHVSNILYSKKTFEVTSDEVASMSSPMVPPYGEAKRRNSFIISPIVASPAPVLFHSSCFRRRWISASASFANWMLKLQENRRFDKLYTLHYLS